MTTSSASLPFLARSRNVLRMACLLGALLWALLVVAFPTVTAPSSTAAGRGVALALSLAVVLLVPAVVAAALAWLKSKHSATASAASAVGRTLMLARPFAEPLLLLWLAVGVFLALLANVALLVTTPGRVAPYGVADVLVLPWQFFQDPLNVSSILGTEAGQYAPALVVALVLLPLPLLGAALAIRHEQWDPIRKVRKDAVADRSASAALRPRYRDLGRADRTDDGILWPVGKQLPSNRLPVGVYVHRHIFRDREWVVVSPSDTHSLVLGASRSGKGVAAVIPPLLGYGGEPDPDLDGHGRGWEGPIVQMTVKPDVATATIAWRRRLGPVFVYDPWNTAPNVGTPEERVGWDPLSALQDESSAATFARVLLPQDDKGGDGGTTDYFNRAALQAITPLLLAAKEAGLTMKDVAVWAQTAMNPPQEEGGPGPLDDVMNTLAGTGHTQLLETLLGILTKDAREQGGVWGTIGGKIQAFSDPKVAASADPAQMPMFDAETFVRLRHATLYIIAPDDVASSVLMRPVFTAFQGTIVKAAQDAARAQESGRLQYDLLLDLDENRNVGSLAGLPHILSLNAGLGINVRHTWQDLSQVEAQFGTESRSVTQNSQVWMILPGSRDPKQLSELSQLLGQRTTRNVSRSRSAENAESESESQNRVEATNQDLLRRLRKDQLLAVVGTKPAIVCRQLRYFEDVVMAARAGTPLRRPGLYGCVKAQAAAALRWVRPLR